MGISLYKIGKWYKMLTGQSISHIHQGVGYYYSKSELKGYYNDLTEKVTKDDEDILVPQYYVDSGEKIYFSIGIFQYGLAAYDLYLKSRDSNYLKKVMACADWAISNQNDDGSWVTFAYKKDNHPFSSMAQAEGISLLVRVAQLTHDEKYEISAKQALDFMLKPVEEGGTTLYKNREIYFLESTAMSPILNGWIFSIWGLYDFWLYFQGKREKNILDETIKTLEIHLKDYDLKYWSKYNISGNTASPFYHELHIAQLKVMYDLTEEKIFEDYALKFQKYQSNWIGKKHAFLKKAIEKIIE